MKLKPFLCISFVILAVFYFIRIYAQNACISENFAILASSVITALGWSISSYLNTRSFKRSEIIKNKDYITNRIDIFFDELLKLVEKRSTTIDDIEEFITTRITTIEFKANQLEKIFKEECQFISTESLAKLRSEPMDIFENSHSDYKKLNQQLNELRKSIHENIESNYSSWLEKNNSI